MRVHSGNVCFFSQVHAPTGPVNREYDDVRRYGEAAGKGIKRYCNAVSPKQLQVDVCPACESLKNWNTVINKLYILVSLLF